jgi:hypothetical protein
MRDEGSMKPWLKWDALSQRHAPPSPSPLGLTFMVFGLKILGAI